MIDFAYAADAAAQPSVLMQFAPLALILVVFYFLIMRPQQKKFKAHQAMIAELKQGDHVILASGFRGKITKVNEQYFSVEIAPRVEVEVERNAIASKVA
ncbi:preprotein translocase subunit YajC [Neisseria weaveri]|uniref:Sec translocon accessory complex subunit YajC n=1 Tax=Neisseria weaveri TaxID=28091 RepID=A0A3S4ZE78_9NEIS|nr:preprotein translocase subunit YajC [Neisseria weaveri]EGV36978.1 preprotein translocase, YajC subunit [Neisseria weaveri ATCC 51223]EGV38108.1 preprotein translocase, YajC subunit [Neisseria weaveri LMG 5135]SAY50366.1 preprotein translocase subunit YajC [Neisseria weaveri]VEJ51774.1 preprotein translocase subunit YajC [Neisseria weaveri]